MKINENKKISRSSIKCHDCGVCEGQKHILGCDNEKCPFCNCQLISCDCIYKYLDLYNKEKYTSDTFHLPPDIYNNGVTEKQWHKWEQMLNTKGRYSYIQYPLMCCLCGHLWPEFFMVSDAEWNKYIIPQKRKEIICRSCYNYIVETIDGNL